MKPRTSHDADISAGLLVEVAIEQNARHSDDPVERRAHLVRDGGEEPRLRLVGRDRPLRHRRQLRGPRDHARLQIKLARLVLRHRGETVEVDRMHQLTDRDQRGQIDHGRDEIRRRDPARMGRDQTERDTDSDERDRRAVEAPAAHRRPQTERHRDQQGHAARIHALNRIAEQHRQHAEQKNPERGDLERRTRPREHHPPFPEVRDDRETRHQAQWCENKREQTRPGPARHPAVQGRQSAPENVTAATVTENATTPARNPSHSPVRVAVLSGAGEMQASLAIPPAPPTRAPPRRSPRHPPGKPAAEGPPPRNPPRPPTRPATGAAAARPAPRPTPPSDPSSGPSPNPAMRHAMARPATNIAAKRTESAFFGSRAVAIIQAPARTIPSAVPRVLPKPRSLRKSPEKRMRTRKARLQVEG